MQGSSLQQGSSNNGQRLEVVVAGDEGSVRLDRVLAVRRPELSRSRLKALILAGQVAIKGAPVRDPAYHVAAGDTITIDVPEAVAAEPAGEDIPLDIVYRGRRHHRHQQAQGPRGASRRRPRDRHAGQRADRPLRRQPFRHRRRQAARHRAPARQGHHRPDGGGQERPRAPIADRAVRRSRPHRRDAARLYGVRLGAAEPPARHRRRADRPASACAREDGGARGRPRGHHPLGGDARASTAATASRSPSLLACQLETGRTHQIRVHLAHIGHPLLGDGVYGPHFKTKAALGPRAQAALAALGRQALHAYLLTWSIPATGEILTGRRPCRRICFSCRAPCGRRNDAGLLKKRCHANRLWQPHGDVTTGYPSNCATRLVYVAPALNIQRGTSQRGWL